MKSLTGEFAKKVMISYVRKFFKVARAGLDSQTKVVIGADWSAISPAPTVCPHTLCRNRGGPCDHKMVPAVTNKSHG